MSTAPAGVNGTTMRNGLVGKFCAAAGTANRAARVRANRRDTELAFEGKVTRQLCSFCAGFSSSFRSPPPPRPRPRRLWSRRAARRAGGSRCLWCSGSNRRLLLWRSQRTTSWPRRRTPRIPAPSSRACATARCRPCMPNLADAVNIEDLRRITRRRLPRAIFDFFDGGAEDEVTLRENRAAFERVKLLPRVLVNVAQIDTSIQLFGKKSN